MPCKWYFNLGLLILGKCSDSDQFFPLLGTRGRDVKRELVDCDAVSDGQVVDALVGGLVRQKLPQHDPVAEN